ncbi:MAG TPA: hypothetical protein VM032_13595 [Vicinamibacterales bacterium]|nr:hypothetical protein [Vicinamibacterales bacterium]
MFELKTLSLEAVPRALAKAERYRLLNEPGEAHSICLDVLAADPGNQEAVRTIILAQTDQFGSDPSFVHDALETVGDLQDGYERAYYTGIIYERRAKAHLAHGAPRAGSRAYEWLRQAMVHFEEADAQRPLNNDDARLRWNACARLITRRREIAPMADEPHEPLLSE